VNAGTLYFLLAGVIVVAVVGRALAFSGRRYLARSVEGGRERQSAGSAAALVSVLFHLLTLGFVALMAAIPFGGSDIQAFLVRIGLLLILVALSYWGALTMLNRRREAAMVSDYETYLMHRKRERSEYEISNDPTANESTTRVTGP
jgi:protein-S-isoprenylcysteine O-methyltransferase Ste14